MELNGYRHVGLDATFGALADSTQPSAVRLIARDRDDQRRPRRLDAQPLAAASEWVERHRPFWDAAPGLLLATGKFAARRSGIVHGMSAGHRRLEELQSSLPPEER